MAIYDDVGRAGDVMSWVNANHGRLVGDAFKACDQGAHTEVGGELKDLIREVEKLARAVQELK